MRIQRLPLYYVLCLLTPMIVTYSVTSLVFWIPPSSGEKISFIVTIFVSNVLFLNFIAGTLPRNMSKMPRLTFIMIMTNIQCFFAMAATIFVVWRHQKDLENSDDERGANLAAKIKEMTNTTHYPTDNKNSYSAANKADVVTKLGFSSLKIQPSKVAQKEGKQMVGKRGRRFWLPPTTWDAIFFCVFHLISVPFLGLLLVI